MNKKATYSIGLILVLAVGLLVFLRAWLLPFNHDEAATFFYYIQNGRFWPFLAHQDANNHFLNSLLSRACLLVFGDHPLSLRLPNVLAFLLMAFPAYRFSKMLKRDSSRLLLFAGLFLSFYWATFFSLCRGYGLSMAFFLLGVSYFFSYLGTRHSKFLYGFYAVSLLAISANLTLVVVSVIFFGLVLVFQLREKLAFKKGVLLANLLFLAGLAFFVKFSMFLKDVGALYYGEGESYFRLTFLTLAQVLSGSGNFYLNFSLVALSLLVVVVPIILYLKKPGWARVFDDRALMIALVVSGLVAAFYLMKKLFGINYPEDRTGLFFYPLVLLVLVFFLDQATPKTGKIAGLGIALLFAIHFILHFNLSKQYMEVYRTPPKRFYGSLVGEQKKSQRKITIGGHFMREFYFAFLNYRNGGYLNLIDPPAHMHLNTDYSIAFKAEEDFYKDYYEELDYDGEWAYVLLKRKIPIGREFLLGSQNIAGTGTHEYFDLIKKDTVVFPNLGPLLVDFDFSIHHAAVPSGAQLVLSLDFEGESIYKRIPLNWLKMDWNQSKNNSYQLITGPLPGKMAKIAIYLWNKDAEALEFTFHQVKLYQLQGEGVEKVNPVRVE